MRPGRTVLSVTPSAATWRATVLKALIIEMRWALESIRFGIGSRTPVEATLTHAAEAALAHPGDDRLDEGHRAEDERRVGRLPLLAREAEGVGAAGRPAGVADEDVDRAERLASTSATSTAAWSRSEVSCT